MKPYQFFTVDRFPNLAPGESVSNDVQLTFSGEGEDIRTTFTMEKHNFEPSLDYVRVNSEIMHETIGYVKKVIGRQRRRIDFIEYLQPVDFPAYLDRGRGIIVFQAPKKTCRGVLSHVKATSDQVKLKEMEVDFAKVMKLCSEYLGAWFTGVSSHVRAAGLTGSQIQDDTLFKRLAKIAALSNVTIPWQYECVEHSVMITSRAGVVLIQNYDDNIGLELRLVMDVYERLLKDVSHERKRRRGSEDAPVEP